MTAYAVTGTLSPDATTPNTGEPAGTLNGQPYWSWGTWFLYWKPGKTNLWRISEELDGENVAGWTREAGDPTDFIGTYQPFTTEGVATVTEYIPEEESSGSSVSSESSSSTSSASSDSSTSSSSTSSTSSPSSFSSTSSISELSSLSESSTSTSSESSSSMSSSSSSSTSSSQSSGTIDLPRSCMVTVTGTFSFTAVIERPTQ